MDSLLGYFFIFFLLLTGIFSTLYRYNFFKAFVKREENAREILTPRQVALFTVGGAGLLVTGVFIAETPRWAKVAGLVFAAFLLGMAVIAWRTAKR